MKRTETQVVIRMTNELRNAVQVLADDGDRTFAAEVRRALRSWTQPKETT